MTYTVAGLLAGYREGRLDPAEVAREFGAATSADVAERWRKGTARALEGVPVMATDDAARAFAAEHGAIVVTAAGAPLALGGGADALATVARAGGTALLAPGLPAMATAQVTDLGAVLAGLGHATGPKPERMARIAGVSAQGDAARRALDLAASLLGGLGLKVQTLNVDGAGRFAAATADVDVLLLPLDAVLAEEAARAGLAVLALPGAWNKGGHLGLMLAGANMSALTGLGARLGRAMGGA